MVHAICPTSERVTPLNVLQGLVLLGLLIDQVFLVSPHQVHSSLLYDNHPDLPVQFMVQLLVRGQFDRMGSFLFGLGVYRCWQQAGLDVNRMVWRLLIGLLVIGLCLSLLRWSVDLLVWYAGLGFTLLYARNQSVKSLVCWMVGLAGLAILVPSLLALVYPAGLTRQSQSFSHYLSYELLMLFGLVVGKLGMVYQDPRLRVRLSLLQLGLLPTAFLLKGVWVVLTLGLVRMPQSVVVYQPLLLALCGFFGPLLLTGVYLQDVALNTRLTLSGWTGRVGRVGRLSLTNYVLQSMLCPFLVHVYGVVVPGPVPIWGRLGIVLSIFALQIGLSRGWGKHNRQGPLERVFCRWVYVKSGLSNAVPTVKL